MISANMRLQQIKQFDKSTSSEKMIFLLNPKDTRVLQALIAWKSTKTQFDKNAMVQQSCTIQQLWGCVDVNVREYSITLGCTVQEGITRLKQLKNLSLIYPDGTINENARLIVSMYIRKKLNDVRGQVNEG